MSTPMTNWSGAVGRVASLDAYRGFVMLAMASAGLGLSVIADRFPGDPVRGFIGAQVDHVEWRGCLFWDLIQPSFMFLVGASLPFSEAARRARGESGPKRFGHAVRRSILLVALGVFLASNGSKQTEWAFTNVLAQIGLGYTVVYLIAGRSARTVLLCAVAILVGTWAAFYFFDVRGQNLAPGDTGWTNSWRPMEDSFFHWEKNVNVAAAFDRWFLNLFPRPDGSRFRYNPGGYATLNFVPSMATMLFGVLAGKLMRSEVSAGRRVQYLILAAASGLALGGMLDQTVCPMVKRIWTPSWTVYSAGWAAGMLAICVQLFDRRGGRIAAFPLVVVGANSIVMYLMAQLIKPWVRSTLRAHLNTAFFGLRKIVPDVPWPKVQPNGLLFGGTYGPLWDSVAVLFALWLVCLGMYRSRLFVKI